MKRRELIRGLEAAGCVLHRHGKRHDIYRNPANGRQAPVPRHREIKEATGVAILILVLVLELRGIRPRPSGNKAAAWTSLVILFFAMLTTVVIACIEFCRVPLESHSSR
jgi:mRNA interferase HicA